MLIASLGAERFKDPYRHWLDHWKAHEGYSPQVEMKATGLMAEAADKLYAVLAEVRFDVHSCLGP
jgi:hypothetical protein